MYSFRPAILIAGPNGSFKSTLAEDISSAYEMTRFSVGNRWKTIYEERKASGKIHPNTLFPYFWANTTVEKNKEANDIVIPMMLAGNVVVDMRYPFMYRDLEIPYYKILMDASLDRRLEGAKGQKKYRGMRLQGNKEKDCAKGTGRSPHGQDAEQIMPRAGNGFQRSTAL